MPRDPLPSAPVAFMPSEATLEAASSRREKRRAGLAAVAGWLTLDTLVVSAVCAASIGFFAASYAISLRDPGYFEDRMFASLPTNALDPITTGAIVASPAGDAMPVPRVVRAKPPVAADYQIVMVFDGEAILATSDELVRVKVGSVVPGLGEVLLIESSDTGGTVQAAEATLRTVAP